MKLKAGILGIALACAGTNADAFSSAYTAISVPGDCFATSWDVNSNVLSNSADYVWTGTVNILANSGTFKFAANRAWALSWGGNFTLLRAPALGVGSLAQGDSNLSFIDFPTGLYAVTFYESTATFDLAPVTPAPNPTAIQLIGSFNGDGATPVGAMTNTSGYVWETSVDLNPGADFLFKSTTASGSANLGATAATGISTLPYSGGNPCASARYTLNVSTGGTFQFTYNLQSNTFSVVRSRTNAFVLASVTAVGDFVAGNPPDINLEKTDLATWRSDFTVTNTSRFTLSFIGRDSIGDIGRFWGLTSATTSALPATGYMLASSNRIYTNLTITATPGSYRITFDSNSGTYVIQQRYAAASSPNYLKDPSFEASGLTNWGLYHADSGEQADFGAHSGARCGVLKAKNFPADADLGNFDQTTAVLSGLSGQTFRVSAAFRTRGVWTAATVRIIVEWKSGTNFISQNSAEITDLTEQWKTYALECIVPSNSVQAKILFKYDGAPGTGYLLIDDAEARIAASRFQDFNGWGSFASFQRINPDWEATSGKTLYNLSANAPTGGVVISKYIEGSENNKAIEIFNGYATPIDLAAGQYVLQQYNNGATSPSVNIALSGTLSAGKCLIVSRLGTPTNAYPPDAEILSAGEIQIQTNALTFNGDDVIVLRQGGDSGPIVDRVGQVGSNIAGSLWSRFATDHSLQRQSGVFWGSTNAPTNAFSLTGWNLLPKDNLSELGIHFFSLNDPGGPYLPTGYSLLLNTNASLLTPELDGGIGDISFYARAQGALSGTPLQIAVETSTSQTSTNWTTHEILTLPLTTTNFTLYTSFSSSSADTVLRLRHIGDGTTNRVRIDDVRVGEAYAIKRSQNFAAWTNFLGSPLGTYTLAEWTIQNAQINTNGFYGSVSADIHPATGSVTSPHYEGGIGTVKYWISQHPSDRGEIRATLLTSTNHGATWPPVATNGLPAPSGTNVLSTNFTVSVNLSAPAAIRISANASPSPFVIDNIEISIPSASRVLTFNDFALNSNYGSYLKDGWNIVEASIVNNLLYSGNSARLRNATITSPYIDSIGPISFYYMLSEFSGDNTARLTVEISPDGNAWTVLNSGIAPAATAQLYSYYNTNANHHYVRIRQTTKDKRILVDQISVDKVAPPPSCTISAALSPLSPTPDEGFYLTADVNPQNGADILSVTGSLRFASSTPANVAMTKVGYGSYRSELQPPRAAGTKITYKASVQYGGIGAIPGSSSYTTNTAFSATNIVTVSAVKRGTVWINELFYGPYEGEEGGGFWGDPYNHEYIELCGVAGTSITNWKVELLFCSVADVQKNGGQATYATYTIPSGTVLTNSGNGFGFYVIGDQELATNHPIDQILTIVVPTNVMPESVEARDHIHDRSGIVRLSDNYGNVVYSLSYGGYDSGSAPIPVAQSLTSNTNPLSLSGTGSEYGDFAWNDDGALTIRAPNTGQTLVPDEGLPPMGAWHTPDAIAKTALQGTFYHFQPIDAAQSDTLTIHYAYTNSAFPTYALIDGRTHHHKQGAGGAWSIATKQVDFTGNYDTNGFAYLRTTLPPYTYDRLDTIEYVIEAIPNKAGLATTFLGSNGDGSSATYATLAEAQQYPFRYTFPIADPIVITKFTVATNWLRLETDGNDTLDPLTNFRVRTTTNLLVPTLNWQTAIVQSITRTNEQNYFTVTPPSGANRYFAVQPLWP